MSESKLQQSCVTWFRLLPNVPNQLLIAVPNEGKRTISNANRMRAEGMQAGVSDLILFHPKAEKRPLFLECKLPKGRQQESQKAFEEVVTAAGYEYSIFRSFDEFREIVEGYLKTSAEEDDNLCLFCKEKPKAAPLWICRDCMIAYNKEKMLAREELKTENA